MSPPTILVVDDEQLIRWSLKEELSREGYRVVEAATKAEALKRNASESPAVMLLDQLMPDGTGLEVLESLGTREPRPIVIMITALDRSDYAVAAMKLGAYDYITKPINMERLKLLIRDAIDTLCNKLKSGIPTHSGSEIPGFCNIVGHSAPMRRVFERITKAAAREDTTVLITGETGTGKELVARAVHHLSSRRKQPLMTVNCSALTETIISSELFGHEKGSFTDARARKAGIFELASGSSVFLDEIGEIAPALQAKLLRVLEEKNFQRVGGGKDIDVDVRIIAATNHDLEARVTDGRFRADLFYRLNIARIHLPPLREREADISLLANHFLERLRNRFGSEFEQFSEAALARLTAHSWPGNVRELKNLLERVVLFHSGRVVESDMLDLGPLERTAQPTLEATEERFSLAEAERKLLIDALEKCHGNQTQAARLLKISRDTLRYRTKKYNIGN